MKSPTSITGMHVPSKSEVVAHAPQLEGRAVYMSSFDQWHWPAPMRRQLFCKPPPEEGRWN